MRTESFIVREAQETAIKQKTEEILSVAKEFKFFPRSDEFRAEDMARDGGFALTDAEAIAKFRNAGKDIINALISNSESFNQRTKFSQEKYLRKKKQKYQVVFEAKKPSAFDLCEAIHSYSPMKICHLRPDALGLMLSLSNVNAQSHTLIVENTRGLISGALVERGIANGLRIEFN